MAYAAFLDWMRLLTKMKTWSTHINGLVVQDITDVANIDVSGESIGSVWMITIIVCTNTVWWV